MSKFSKVRYFESGKGVVETENGVISRAYDASNLFNVKPAHIVMQFTREDNAPTVVWDDNVVTITHTLNCYPMVKVYTSEGYEIAPEVRVTSGTTVELDFDYYLSEGDMGLQVNEDSPLMCVLSYAGEYGDGSNNPNVGNISSLATTLEVIRELFAANGGSIGVQTCATLVGVADPTTATEGIVGQHYINSTTRSVFMCKAIEGDTQNPSYVWDRVVFDSDSIVDTVRSVLPNVITIPSQTWEYALHDASYAPNGHCFNYKHLPLYPSMYLLPEVTDNTTAHEINLEVDYSVFYIDEDKSDFTSANGYAAWTRRTDGLTVYTVVSKPPESGDDVYADALLDTNITEIISADSSYDWISLNTPHLFYAPDLETEITPAISTEIIEGDLVHYIFKWSNSQQKWCVMPVILDRTVERSTTNNGGNIDIS